jgi:hypothetical protein
MKQDYYHNVTVRELIETLEQFDPNDTIKVVDIVPDRRHDRYDEFAEAGYKLMWQPVNTPTMQLQRYGLLIADYLVTLRSEENK